MDTVPPEILGAIAAALPSTADMRSFRLVCRSFAYAGFSVLFRRVSVMDTLQYVEKKLQLLRDSPYGSLGTTKHLTVYHGSWPRLTCQGDWANHPLWVGRRRWASSRTAQDAFYRYMQFISQEARRESKLDTQLLELIRSFPTLRSITMSHVHAWSSRRFDNAQYNALIGKIWILPYWHSFIADAVFRLLPILYLFPHVYQLKIYGSLSVEHAVPGVYPTIRHLCVRSLVSCNRLGISIHNFLASFPNLRELSVRLEPGGPLSEQGLPLDTLYWTELRSCALYNLWISEDELLSFIERHGQLRRLALDKITLVQGAWESFFVRYRDLPNKPSIEDQAVLSAIGSPGCVIDPDSLRLYLSRKDYPWVFSNSDDGDTIFPFYLE